MMGHGKMIVAVAAMLLAQVAVLGCECDYLPKHSTAFRKAKAVFIGRVVGVTRHPPAPEKWDDDRVPFVEVVTFKVVKSWKGGGGTEAAVWMDAFFSCSSMGFRDGDEYLVYANEHRGALVAYWCGHSSLTSPLSSAEARKQIKQLDSFWFRTRARLFPF